MDGSKTNPERTWACLLALIIISFFMTQWVAVPSLRL